MFMLQPFAQVTFLSYPTWFGILNLPFFYHRLLILCSLDLRNCLCGWPKEEAHRAQRYLHWQKCADSAYCNSSLWSRSQERLNHWFPPQASASDFNFLGREFSVLHVRLGGLVICGAAQQPDTLFCHFHQSERNRKLCSFEIDRGGTTLYDYFHGASNNYPAIGLNQ